MILQPGGRGGEEAEEDVVGEAEGEAEGDVVGEAEGLSVGLLLGDKLGASVGLEERLKGTGWGWTRGSQ